MIDRIKENLKFELPGIKAWEKMAVRNKGRPKEKLDELNEWAQKKNTGSLKEAAIILILIKKKNDIVFPLIRRPDNIKNHPGQIALPGGAREGEEKLKETAKREAQEEIGIKSEDIKIIGQLTPIPVPVSGYLVHPFVGTTSKIPEWKLSKKEVADFFIIKLSRLLDSDNDYFEEWNLKGEMVEVPIFKLKGLKIWGATASVLSEFIELTKKRG